MTKMSQLSDFDSLVEQVKNCSFCEPELAHNANPLFQIHPNAKILIAGHAPGKKAHQSGIPFDDPSGQRLRQWLGITTEQFYNPELVALLPMGFCYPGTGKQGDFPPRPECEPAWRSSLLSHLQSIEITLVLGRYALDYHFNHRGTLTELVVDWQSHWPRRVPLPHPSPRNNRWLKNNPWFEADLIPLLQTKINQIVA